ncbi:long-chain-fatty-acid--CoA ligase 4 [Galendromus occidentalis]|uniref:long-chain-fatty-acid--CoA ligase n=1 Tax=Galendromus occidentalis TaxID=34638 RepID=A0AAJ7L314_9ACAR|nr:long-chain-fatty-acid--CoA ligase 4 [Galendromus occidentalis]
MVKMKNSIFRKVSKTSDDQEPYAERVYKDDYAPYVKSSFRSHCCEKYPDEKPLGRLESSRSMAEVFRHAVRMHGDKPCMGYRPLLETLAGEFEGRPINKLSQGGYKFHSYETVDQLVDFYGRGFREIGIRPHDRVAILAETCFEWMCIALALMRYNMPIVTLYATLSEEGVVHGLTETRVSTVVTSQDLLERMRDRFAKILTLKHIIYLERVDKPVPRSVLGKELMSSTTLRNLGEHPENDYRPEDPKPHDVAILMYTSGSTGVPKAVTLTHLNLLSGAKGLGEVFESLKVRTDDAYVAYLPLAHVFELTCEIIAILFGVKIGYSSATTLTDNSPSIIPGQQGDCSILQPTIMPAVPLMLDRVKKAVIRKCREKGAVSARVLELAIQETLKRHKRGQDATIYDKDIFAQIRSVVGGKLRIIATGSAPLSPETHAFIRSALGCLVIQGYGLTESCAAATCMTLDDDATGEVGCPVVGAYVKLEDWQEGGYFVKDNKGEIILGGEMIAAGYFNNERLSAECFFEEGGIRWFRTGDIGEVTDRGTFKIIDRKKDLVKLQHGEYISLGKPESGLVTAAMKLCRKEIQKKYQTELDQLYR